MNQSYCIYGASGHSKVIIEIIEKGGGVIKGLYDDDPLKKRLLDYEVTNQKSIFDLPGVDWIIGIGDNETRKKVAEENLLSYGIAIDRKATISDRNEIGTGTVIMPGVTINSSTVIGKHAIINTNSSVDHDCILEDYVHVSPNATLCGGVRVGEGTHVGAGAVIIPGIKIGRWSTIGAGSVIIKDVPDFVTVVGNPGRIIK
ncbi:MAG: acetyltransferase [Bacteroidota bacterium]|nr:acetyltransferase [Bacteroidota bacterium]